MPKERSRNSSDDHSTVDRHDKQHKDLRKNFVKSACALSLRDNHYLNNDSPQQQSSGVDQEIVDRREYHSADILQHHRYSYDYEVDEQYNSELVPVEYYGKSDRHSACRREQRKRKKSKKSKRDASENGTADDKVNKTVAAVKALVDYGNGTSDTDSSTGESSLRTRSSRIERRPGAHASASEMLGKRGHGHHRAFLNSKTFTSGYDSPLGSSHRDLPRRLRTGEPEVESSIPRQECQQQETPHTDQIYLDPVSSESQKSESKRSRELHLPMEISVIESKAFNQDTSPIISAKTKSRHHRSTPLSSPDLAHALSHSRSGHRITSEKLEKQKKISRQSLTWPQSSAVEKSKSKSCKTSVDEMMKRRDSPISHSPDILQRRSPLFDSCERSQLELPVLEASKHKDRTKKHKTSSGREKPSKRSLSPHLPVLGFSGENTFPSSATPPMPVLSRISSPRDSSGRASPASKKCSDENRKCNLNSESSRSRHYDSENSEVVKKSTKSLEKLRQPSTPTYIVDKTKRSKHIDSASSHNRSAVSGKKQSRPKSSSDDEQQNKSGQADRTEDIPRSYQDTRSPSRKKSRLDTSISGKCANNSKTVEFR